MDKLEVDKIKPADTKSQNAAISSTYERPQVKSMNQDEVLSAVEKGSKFPARGFSG